jgi:hypothetical protein
MKAYSLIIKSVFVAGLLAASGVSFATIISGSIGMGGSFDPINSSGALVDLDDATGIDFTGDMFRVSAASTGDFAALAGMDGTITDLQFDPFTGPVVDFWTVGGFSFELTMLDDITAPGFESMFLNLSGEGIISHTDFENTLGTWRFAGTGGGGIFTWAAVSAAEGGGTQDSGEDYMSVPEPMALALIGIGLVGFGGVRGFRGRRAPGKK